MHWNASRLTDDMNSFTFLLTEFIGARQAEGAIRRTGVSEGEIESPIWWSSTAGNETGKTGEHHGEQSRGDETGGPDGRVEDQHGDGRICKEAGWGNRSWSWSWFLLWVIFIIITIIIIIIIFDTFSVPRTKTQGGPPQRKEWQGTTPWNLCKERGRSDFTPGGLEAPEVSSHLPRGKTSRSRGTHPPTGGFLLYYWCSLLAE